MPASIGSPSGPRKAAPTAAGRPPIRQFLAPAALLIALGLLLAALPRGGPRRVAPAAPPAPEAARILADLRGLAAFPTRFAGSRETPAVQDWLRAAIAARGLAVREQRVPLRVGAAATEQVNFFCELAGRDPGRPLLVLCAHYDSVNEGWIGETPSLADPESPAPGADDNASGVAVLLEAMRLLAADPPARGTLFLFTAAEEMGQAGAEAWVAAATATGLRIGWVVNVDQVGESRSGPRALQLFSHGPGLPLAARVRALGERGAPAVLGWRLHPQDTLAKSDHGPFLARGIPAVSLSEGPGYYPWEAQGVGDKPERLDPVLLADCARLLVTIARDPALPRATLARPRAASR